jgi:prepilin-type N-terminal cleavage/methylation domain-containing protein/prepilin-type processing-associated H-X9-DG protein
MRRICRRGFTLVELLVVIGIIAVLIGVLLPALNKARQSSMTLKCAANLRSIGQGLALYVAENRGVYPAAYIYEGMKIDGDTQTPDSAINGYVHWSSYLYKRGKGTDAGMFRATAGWEAFQCPTIDNGGLPPTNTTLENLDSGQQNDDGSGVLDQQAPRLAYTVNEAIMPRNKFAHNMGAQSPKRTYQFVRAAAVKKPADTILATEWNQSWRIVSDTGRSDPGATVCKSHRPVHGYTSSEGLNMDQVAPDAFGRNGYKIFRAKVSDLAGDPQPGQSFNTRLDWVGRNHGSKVLKGGFDQRRTNFLYVDGHVETKNIKETLEPQFQWGEKFYSLTISADIQP